MELNEYQQKAAATDQYNDGDSQGMIIALLGLGGEVGSLLTLYKKWQRDGDAYSTINDRIAEELGDVLWYIATIARRSSVDLEDVATRNLTKVSERWLPSKMVGLFD